MQYMENYAFQVLTLPFDLEDAFRANICKEGPNSLVQSKPVTHIIVYCLKNKIKKKMMVLELCTPFKSAYGNYKFIYNFPLKFTSESTFKIHIIVKSRLQ